MNKPEYLLLCLMEECDEVSQRCAKALRFGLGEVQPGQELTNEQRLIGEYADLRGVMEILEDENILFMDQYLNEKIEAKKAKIKKYMQYSREQGCLND